MRLAAGGGGGMGGSTPVPTSNNAPMAGSDISISLTEDVSAGALNLSAPTDSDGDSLTIAITAIPTSGSLKKADGTVLTNGDALTTSELEGLTFTTGFQHQRNHLRFFLLFRIRWKRRNRRSSRYFFC